MCLDVLADSATDAGSWPACHVSNSRELAMPYNDRRFLNFGTVCNDSENATT